MPGAVWNEVGAGGYELPADKPLSLASFAAAVNLDLYVDHLAVGDPIPELPLFLTGDTYVNLPLGPSYLAAFDSIPDRYRRVLTGIG
jgi:hypothetical protein